MNISDSPNDKMLQTFEAILEKQEDPGLAAAAWFFRGLRERRHAYQNTSREPSTAKPTDAEDDDD